MKNNSANKELPPRARRIPSGIPDQAQQIGTTSAHAENTLFVPDTLSSFRNYLRARGEYQQARKYSTATSELPPRTRRIPRLGLLTCVNRGTTSAHAENAGGETTRPSGVWNYLRARGEYARGQPHAGARRELPPRTRRIRRDHARLPREQGTTSAHAENTPTLTCPARWKRNYLRARGEYSTAKAGKGLLQELPPRARRIPLPHKGGPS